MKKGIRLTLAAVLIGAAVAPSAKGITYTDRATWEAAVPSFGEVDETQWGTGYTPLTAGTTLNLPLGLGTIAFDVDLYGAQVPTDWATWSGGNTPSVLSTVRIDPITFLPTFVNSVEATFSNPVSAFGVEMEPNEFALFEMTLSTGETITQTVNGSAGAAFFGWSDAPVISFTMTIADVGVDEFGFPFPASGFAFGRMVAGVGAPPPNGVPEGGSLLLVSSLTFAGLVGFARRRQ
jgi:hypothetical protein